MAIERRAIVDREQWLAWRRQDVTASTVGALFGAHPYVSALRLYAEKRGVEFLDEDNKVKRRGRWLEPAIGEAVRELRPAWRVEPARCYLRDGDHRLGATPDFFICDDPRGLGVLQCKSAAPAVFARDWAGGEEIPLWIILQTATEMMLADAAFGVVAVLLNDPFDMDCAILELPRDAAAERKILRAVDKFWADTDAGQEPPLDPARDAETVAALSPKATTGEVRDLTGSNELPVKLAHRASLKDVISSAELECEQIETELKYLLGNAEAATGIPGWKITYKNGMRKGYTVAPKEKRTLRITDQREPRSDVDA